MTYAEWLPMIFSTHGHIRNFLPPPEGAAFAQWFHNNPESSGKIHCLPTATRNGEVRVERGQGIAFDYGSACPKKLLSKSGDRDYTLATMVRRNERLLCYIYSGTRGDSVSINSS
mgnify:CR=1 FL=1